MIQKLTIRNYALIDFLEIDFSSGLTVMTGETGAGKSIILGALSLILGERADSKVIKNEARKTVVEGIFDIAAYDLQPFFQTNDLDYDDTGICILRRELLSGKSRSFINDTPVSLGTLKELGVQLIDIHSQHQNLLLGDNRFQLRIIDLWAHDENLLSEYRREYRTYKELCAKLEQLRRTCEESRKEEEYLRFQYNQLCEARLQEGEQKQLEEERETLAHAEEIKQGLYAVSGCLDSEENGALSQLREALHTLRSLHTIYSGADELAERMESSVIELKDIQAEIENRQERVTADPERLQQVEERLDLLYGLQQKHRVQSDTELLAIQADLEAKLSVIDHSDAAIADLQQQVVAQEQHILKLSGELSACRQTAAGTFTAKLIERTAPLGMNHLRFEVEWLQKERPDIDGAESARYLFSANKNRPLQPVAEIASGGEISRLMLGIKSLAADATALPTIVFDEIDTGVSGEIADKMGEIMADMAKYMQVIAITHLPQVASRGDHHFRIYKNDEGDTARTCMEPLSDEQRLQEIARMLSGAQISDAALSNARELLNRN